ncbi:MAG: MBL fold metallo-hydrolase, partial [Planctomycetia bacterium]|nr:MBL fold metallo-hydrolase [Planctomycetia bacterium]
RMGRVLATEMTESMESFLRKPVHGGAERTNGCVLLRWLGQAGFLIRFQDGERTECLVIDPYLSDSLAVKYRGKILSHQRMMPPPVMPDLLRDLRMVLCTHAHSDHLDPGTLPILAENSPECGFVTPYSAVSVAIERGVPASRLKPLRDGESLKLSGQLRLTAVASAHETRQYDEAATLCLEAGIPIFVPMHFGMFDFNTLPEPELERKSDEYASRLNCVRPRIGSTIVLNLF